VRYYRAFTIRDGMLASPVRVSHRWPGPGPVFTATCEVDPSHQPPEPRCTCGLYLWTARGGWMCLRSRAPRVYAEVEPLGLVLPSPSWCPVYSPDRSARVRAFRLLSLWLPGPGHCLLCGADFADPKEPKASEQDLAALADRYQVPVGRLP
jgi:hypothetical protein